jgi:biotin carboxyl carrier protein
VKLIVRRGEREEQVQVQRNDCGYEVTIGERSYRVDVASPRAGLKSLRIDGGHYEVAVQRQSEGVYRVSTAHGTGQVEVVDPLTHLASQTRGDKGGKRRQRVDAYMPGRVVALLAEEGREVATGQGILVLEAMKMENEIRAEQDGTLIRIFVQPGQAVETGNPLFELE